MTIVELDATADVDVLEPITDEELTALALAADPDQTIDDDAVPLTAFQGEFGDILPDWYMPAPASISSSRGRRRRNALVGSVIIFSLLFINALGLCITYGRLEVPF
ncbi:MAG: hypothetical protein JWL72_4810 [Ilumatobacteraceae bacterium]|nr:hypothetical protein [Ilumatobacteraceae bacterium]MCU1391472.1 hypothetical protein [Ilumatobacteraceae bacterium]